jgi:hypothetical protein
MNDQPDTATARRIAANPATHSPALRQDAWQLLVETRGGLFRPETIPQIIQPDPTADMPMTLQQCLDLQAPAVRARIHARAAQLGHGIERNRT